MKFTNQSMSFGLNFAKYENVSSTNFGLDELIVSINSFEYFV